MPFKNSGWLQTRTLFENRNFALLLHGACPRAKVKSHSLFLYKSFWKATVKYQECQPVPTPATRHAKQLAALVERAGDRFFHSSWDMNSIIVKSISYSFCLKLVKLNWKKAKIRRTYFLLTHSSQSWSLAVATADGRERHGVRYATTTVPLVGGDGRLLLPAAPARIASWVVVSKYWICRTSRDESLWNSLPCCLLCGGSARMGSTHDNNDERGGETS